MQTFSHLRRSFFDNTFAVILSAFAAVIVSSYFSSKFIPIAFGGISFLAFVYYVDLRLYLQATLVLILQTYISVLLGYYLFDIVLFYSLMYIVVLPQIRQITLPENVMLFIYLGLIYFVFLVLQLILGEMSLHLLYVVFINLLIDLILMIGLL